MGRPGFSFEDGSGLLEFEVEADVGSSDTSRANENIRHEYSGVGRNNRPVFNWVIANKQKWTFIWTAITNTFFDALTSFMIVRRFLFYPDKDNLDHEFLVKARITRLPLSQTKERVTTRLDIEEW